MKVLLLSGDLLIFSQLDGTARHFSATLEQLREPRQLVARCREESIALVLIDLTAAVEVANLVAELRSLEPAPVRIAAFGPHVHEGRLREAREAGCDDVFRRGELAARFAQIVAAG